jgi:hypothetical protein
MHNINFSDSEVTPSGRAPSVAVCRSAGSDLRIGTRHFCCVVVVVVIIVGLLLLLRILLSFDWLAAFHPELLQAILFIAV